MAVAEGAGLPLAVHTTSDSPHEVSLVKDALLESFVYEFPDQLIGDKAYDSDPLDEELAKAGIEMIAPNRVNRKNRIRFQSAISSLLWPHYCRHWRDGQKGSFGETRSKFLCT